MNKTETMQFNECQECGRTLLFAISNICSCCQCCPIDDEEEG